MKKILLTMLALLLALPVMARDFEYTYEGQTITYTVIDEEAKTCKTKDGYQEKYTFYPGNSISGEVILPANPKDGDIEYTLTEIGEYAFCNCEDLQSVILPPSIERFPRNAMYVFAGCRQLKKFACPSGTENMYSYDESVIIYDRNGVITEEGFIYGADGTILYFVPISYKGIEGSGGYEVPENVTTVGKSAFRGCRDLGEVPIHNSVTHIGEYAFSDCSGLLAARVPNSVTKIEQGTFANCTSLEFVDLPNSITGIGDNAFLGCKTLQFMPIPNSITRIGDGVFAGCESLPSITIPNSVTRIGEAAFAMCYGLTSMDIPNSVTYLGQEAFAQCINLTSVDISNSMTSISIGAFMRCNKLKSVTIPNSVTTIEPFAFCECMALTSIELPKSVTSIGESAFMYCTALSSIVCQSREPISQIQESTFDMSCYEKATLYVPEGCVDAYKEAKVWSNFYNISDEDVNGVDMIEGNHEGIDYSQPYEVYNLNGVKFGEAMEGLAKGTYIVRQGSQAVKVSVK